MNDTGQIEIYQAEDGQTEIQVRLEKDTLWLSQAQMSELFDTDQSGVARHLSNVFSSGELKKNSNMQKMHIAGSTKPVNFYSLDAIISVGYRVNSKKGTHFRIWATQRLKEYLVKGYSVNQKRFQQNAAELQQALALIQKAAQAPALKTDMGRGLVDIMGRYTQTFLWLQQYDEGLLREPKGQAGGVLPSPNGAMAALKEMKTQLMERGEASDLFGRSSKPDSLAGIFGNLDQTVFGEPAYPTIESKAAHLLYFVVKNHPFIDGNKRSGAFLFVDFLHRNGRLLNAEGQIIINETGLAALTLLVAESAPKQKETMIQLTMNLLCEPDASKLTS